MPDGRVIISRDTVAALLAAAQAWERATVHLQVVGRQAEAVWRLGQAITEAERVLTQGRQDEIQRLQALLAERDAEIARLREALGRIYGEARWQVRLNDWRQHGMAAVGTQPNAAEACREIVEIVRAARGGAGRDGE